MMNNSRRLIAVQNFRAAHHICTLSWYHWR